LTNGNPTDTFVHHAVVTASGFSNPDDGRTVEFDVTDGPKGPMART